MAWVAVVEQVEPVAVGLHGPDGLVVAVAGSGPCVVFNLGGVDLCVGEHDAVAGHHAADVVAVEMGYIKVVYIRGCDAERVEAGVESGTLAAVAGVEEYQPVIGAHQEGTYR